MRMEHEVTGLYLSGHPMDEYRVAAKSAGAAGIGDILADFAREGGNIKFKDNQKIMVSGVIVSVKSKPTRNNSLMAYLTADDGSGSIELLAFQKIIDESGGYMQVNTPVMAAGRLSARDEKEPQIVVDTLRPISDIVNPEYGIQGQTARGGALGSKESGPQEKTLYVKLRGENGPEYERLKLVHMMFPGGERMVIHFSDTKKSVGAKCVIHDAFVRELCDMLGEQNVVVKG
jgi:DNA polymerase-3 subunit alpha